MEHCISEYYRCPEHSVSISDRRIPGGKSGFFKFGEYTLYGQVQGGHTAKSPSSGGVQVSTQRIEESGGERLPFDLTEVVNNLRYEAYSGPSSDWHPASSAIGRAYYFVRPILPVALRRHFQKLRLNDWPRLRFPEWPVDCTVDALHEKALSMSLRAARLQEIPFVWFWPNGTRSCAILTHDVETTAGRDFSPSLMDIDDHFGFKASFQVVPENRYEVPESYLQQIRDRGFEVNVQDLNHDGHLFRERKEFLARAAKIERYRKQFGAEGFRSAILYRRQEWYNSLSFSYDMSVPNVAHLDPQRGGCCTVMPYFVGGMVELPVTMTQDYSLFHILNDHSIDLWKRQLDLVMAKYGLANFIIHPDYVTTEHEMATYKELLGYLRQLAVEKNIWMPLPRDVASWWRDRANMRLVEVNGRWQIEGKGSERARIAYASEKDGKLAYSFQSLKDKSLTESTEVGMLTSRPS